MDSSGALQAADIGDMLYQLTLSLEDFRNGQTIPDDLLPGFDQNISQISQYSQYMYAHSATLVLDEVQASLTKLKNITGEINNNINKLKNVQKAIDVAVSMVTVCSAIIELNPGKIVSSVSDLINTWKS
jgi:hypothetical protein